MKSKSNPKIKEIKEPPILYVVHETLLKIVSGKPLTQPRDKYTREVKVTKYGKFWGGFLQFNLYDKNKVVISVYWNCKNCYDNYEEAAANLNKLINENIKYIENKIKGKEREIKNIRLDIDELLEERIQLVKKLA